MNLRPLRPDHQQKVKPPKRWSYYRNSTDFVHWVNKLGIEKTVVGRFASALDSKFNLRGLILLFVFALAVSFYVNWDFDVSFIEYKEGDVALNDIKSSLSFELIDEHQTDERRLEAEKAIPPVFDYDTAVYDQLIARARQNFTRGQNSDNFELDFGEVQISPQTEAWLKGKKFEAKIQQLLIEALEDLGALKIIEDASVLPTTGRRRIALNILDRERRGEETIISSRSVLDSTQVEARLKRHRVCQGLFSGLHCEQMVKLTKSFIVPNLFLNKQLTASQRQKARDSISPFLVQVKKGQVIINKGTPVQKIQMDMLRELKRFRETRHLDFISLITAVFLVIVLISYRQYMLKFMANVSLSPKDAYAMATIIFVVLTIAKFILYIGQTALVEKFGHIPPTVYAYILPLSAASMMVCLLIPSGEIVVMFALFFSILSGLLLDRNFNFMVVTFAASLVAARGVYSCKKREDLYSAGLKCGAVNASLIFCATLMTSANLSSVLTELVWNTSMGFVSGLLSGFVTLTLIPFFETFFVYSTDVKLLELSNLNHPLLKDLIVKAPGTYHHSLVVGSMCEAAAEAIGANPLLAKVCAYYHDIGKTHYAKYFIENQRPGENKHDELSPAMSKTILVAHVKDGLEMGLHYKLGKPILDVISQHHGTTLISFFFHKAKETEVTENDEIKENEFRYPGPKPQFREAALCMLADSVEAAARTLDEPTSSRLQSIVKNIVQKKFLDGQLDECDLTLKDLTGIEEAFNKILIGIYHQRIDYPTGRMEPKANGSKRGQQTVS